MPTYEYKCEECGIVFERFQHFSEEPLRVCPECNGAVHRLLHPVGIIFKGKGFYVTDHKSNTSSLMPKSEKSTESAADKSNASESKSSTESKPAADA
ncbi:MAG: FmdB family zinc ribbon protein [Anaerolineae bacterium]